MARSPRGSSVKQDAVTSGTPDVLNRTWPEGQSPGRLRGLPLRAKNSKLLHQTQRIVRGPVLHDFARPDAPDHNPAHLDLFPRPRDAKKICLVGAVSSDPRHDFVTLGDQLVNGMIPGRGAFEKYERLLQALEVARYPRQRIVGNEVPREKLLEDIGVPLVDRFKVTAYESLVRFSCHRRPALPLLRYASGLNAVSAQFALSAQESRDLTVISAISTITKTAAESRSRRRSRRNPRIPWASRFSPSGGRGGRPSPIGSRSTRCTRAIRWRRATCN